MFTSLRRVLSSTQAHRTLQYAPTPLRVVGRYLSTSRSLYGPRIVYLANLPFNAEVEDVKDRAETFGALTRITMPNDDRDRPGGFANVEFQEESSAQNFFEAVKKEGLELGGRKVVATLVESHQQRKMSLPQTETLHIANFPYQPTVEQVEALFEQFGQTVKGIRVGQGYTRPYAHVTFVTKEAAIAAHQALKAEPPLVENSALYVDFAATKTRDRVPAQPNETLYFRGTMTENELRDLVRPHADSIERIHFFPQEVHRKNRAGHINCRNIEAATEILETYGDQILLEYSLPRREGGRPQSRKPPARGRQFSRDSDAQSVRSRSTYGGDWNGGKRSERYYKKFE